MMLHSSSVEEGVEKWQDPTEHYTGWWLGHPSEKYESQLG